MTHPRLSLRFKKRPNAASVLTLVRADGTSTSGEIGPAHGYGPVHDMAHYVVERTLGLSAGFLGLVASGWKISDFEVKGAAKRLPPEAMFAECTAGELSRQEMMQQYSTAEEFAWAVMATLDRSGYVGYTPPALTAERFEQFKAELGALRDRWALLPESETLILEF
jgi:hypothetical protein